MSMRRTSRRYLRGAVDTTHDFQEFLNENPAVASGLASVGNLLLNALMQSKYGPAIQGLLTPGAQTAADAPAAPPKPAAAASKVKKSSRPRPAAKKVMKKKVSKKKVSKKK